MIFPFFLKKDGKSPIREVPRLTAIFMLLMFSFPLSHTNSLSGLLPGRAANWPLFSEKLSKIFRFRPSGQVGARHRHPPMIAPQSLIPFIQVFSANDQRKTDFFEKSFDPVRLSAVTYIRKKSRNVHPFSEKTFHTVYSKFFGK